VKFAGEEDALVLGRIQRFFPVGEFELAGVRLNRDAQERPWAQGLDGIVAWTTADGRGYRHSWTGGGGGLVDVFKDRVQIASYLYPPPWT
jgi:hypothetical protein